MGTKGTNSDPWLEVAEKEIETKHVSQRSSLGLRFHWGLLSVLTALFLFGTTGYFLSSTPTVGHLDLILGNEVMLSPVRPFPDVLRLSLSFKGVRRAAHGDFTGRRGPQGGLEFVNPGEPIRLLVQVDNREVGYEATPVSSHGSNSFSRTLVPFVEDGNPKRISWDGFTSRSPSLSAGRTPVRIKVQDVGPEIRGEQAEVIISAPVGVKGVARGYAFFWWFMWWPVYLLPLLAYAWFVFRKTYNEK